MPLTLVMNPARSRAKKTAHVRGAVWVAPKKYKRASSVPNDAWETEVVGSQSVQVVGTVTIDGSPHVAFKMKGGQLGAALPQNVRVSNPARKSTTGAKKKMAARRKTTRKPARRKTTRRKTTARKTTTTPRKTTRRRNPPAPRPRANPRKKRAAKKKLTPRSAGARRVSAKRRHTHIKRVGGYERSPRVKAHPRRVNPSFTGFLLHGALALVGAGAGLVGQFALGKMLDGRGLSPKAMGAIEVGSGLVAGALTSMASPSIGAGVAGSLGGIGLYRLYQAFTAGGGASDASTANQLQLQRVMQARQFGAVYAGGAWGQPRQFGRVVY